MSTIQHPPGAGGEHTPGGRGADSTAAGDTLGRFETRLLADLQMLVAERVATTAQEAGPTGRRAGRGTVRRLAMTGGLAASLAAVLAATLTLTSAGGARPPTGNFAPSVTAAAVLNNAALASLREPTVTPRRDQFVYYKTYVAFRQTIPGERHPAVRTVTAVGTETVESWASVSGTRPGLEVDSVKHRSGHNATERRVRNWCAHGYVHSVPPYPDKVACTPGAFAAFRPWLPTSTAGMRAYLERQLRQLDGPYPGYLLADAFYLLTSTYLTPAQQAAMYHALATFPGLTVVPKVTAITGQVGVGVRYHSAAKHITWTAIFDPTTFKPLGSNMELPLAHDRFAAVVTPTIVDKVGQLP